MDTEELKSFTIKHGSQIPVIFGLLASIVTISIALKDINKWLIVFICISIILLLSLCFYLYVKKSKNFRLLNSHLKDTIEIFEKTHNTWHIFKRLSDSMLVGVELDEVRQRIHRDILNIISNYRDSLSKLHNGKSFSISLKAICYKDINALNKSDGITYKDIPFLLRDLPLFRDTGSGPIKQEDIIDRLDFDNNTNRGEMNSLYETLFYKSFISKTVVFASSFNNIQQSYTHRFKSGLVVPVILHEIPFALICVGCYDENVFNDNDRQLSCTFADAISEFIRLERIFNSIVNQKVIIIMKGSEESEKIMSEIHDRLKMEGKRDELE